MERYDNNPIIQTVPTVQYPKVIKYRSSTRYPDIPLSENDVLLYTIRGDRLDNLAQAYYNDATLWWVIAMANNNSTKGFMYPEPGTQLRVPTNLNAVLVLFDNFNKAR